MTEYHGRRSLTRQSSRLADGHRGELAHTCTDRVVERLARGRLLTELHAAGKVRHSSLGHGCGVVEAHLPLDAPVPTLPLPGDPSCGRLAVLVNLEYVWYVCGCIDREEG